MTIDLNSPWPYLAVAAFAALIGWYVWKQPRWPGTRYFSWLVGIWLVWALVAALQTVIKSPELQYGLWVLQSIFVLVVAPVELLFCLEYTGNEKWLARRSLLLIFLPALLFLVMALILPGSTASFESHSGIRVIIAQDLVRWGLFAYIVFLELIMLGVLFACLLSAPAFWAPILLIILGRIVPTLAYAALDPQRLTVSPIEVSILLASFSMLAYFVAVFSFRLLRVLPVARDMVISHMPYSLIVLDAENRLVDFNAAARMLPGLPRLPRRPGVLARQQAAAQALGSWWERISPLIGPEPAAQDVTVQAGSEELIFRVMSLPLLQASGWRMGQVFVLEDVTQLRQSQRQEEQILWAQATLEERKQLADELHDGLSQSLAFLNFQVQAAQVYLQAGKSEAAQASLARLNEAAGEIQEDTRELISSLLSVSQPAENFCDTLGQILADFERQTGLMVHVEIDRVPAQDLSEFCDSSRLPPSAAVQLMRITQEALANVRKHAHGAHQVDVQFITRDGQLLMTIADDGAGFDPAAQQSDGKHFGLQVMLQRAARMGGQIQVNSTPGRGTQIQVCIPLDQDPERKSLQIQG